MCEGRAREKGEKKKKMGMAAEKKNLGLSVCS